MPDITNKFGTIAIIGTGLIGGSLALALKEKGAVSCIVGCSRNIETLNEAKGLGIIDEGFTDPADAVSGADIIVLCTPLSSYHNIITRCIPNLSPEVIITDVGSVKDRPSQDIIDALPSCHHPFFVPGHPIAGTEKSGPNAAFSSLYHDKNIILTPLKYTHENALEKVTQMWQIVGAEVENISPTRHDFIYASVSHIVQLVSSCYGLLISRHGSKDQGKVIGSADVDFIKFIRLCGSDPVMWRDIFSSNSHNIEIILRNFSDNLKSIIQHVEQGLQDVLAYRLERARDKRQAFQIASGVGNIQHSLPCENSKGHNCNVLMDMVPRLIACLIMEGVAASEYGHATGAGLHGLSRNLLLENGARADDILANKKEILQYLNSLSMMLDVFYKELEKGDSGAIEQLLSEARATYLEIIK